MAGKEGSPKVLYAMKAPGITPPFFNPKSPRSYVLYSLDMFG